MPNRAHRYCDACHRPFWYDEGREIPQTCARLYCLAWQNWDDDQWRWRAEQAALTRALGVEPNDFDTEALRRFPQPSTV